MIPSATGATCLFDSHIHLDLLPAAVEVAGAALVPALTPTQWLPLLRRYRNNAAVWLALGAHPSAVAAADAAALRRLRRLLRHPKVVALGEVGLDGRYGDDAAQLLLLRRQMELAATSGKALVLHCVRRYHELVPLLEQQDGGCGGVLHGFSGGSDLAARLWRAGFAIGIGRTVLNPAAKKLRTAVAALPDAALLLETDAPWPRGCGEDGSNALERIAAAVAQIRGQRVEQVATYTAANARRIFSLTD